MDAEFILKRVSDGEEFALPLGSALVGRSDSCDIQVLIGQASREHARVRVQADGAVVEDLHSTNGTFINDKRIDTATLLQPGDVVRFDQESFSLQRKDQANTTIYARPVAAKAAAMNIEEQDEEDVNATAYRQTFVMPPGWHDIGTANASPDNREQKKQQALDNFINKSFRGLKGKHLIALIFSKNDEPPIIKTVSTDAEQQRWRIGRNQHCEVVVDQPDISDEHCFLDFNQSGWSLTDNQSTNGLWLRNKRQTAVTLGNKLQLHLASLAVEVRIETRE